MKPTVLIATTYRWFPTARLAMALANAGFTVEAVCPTRHPLATTSAIRKPHVYHGLSPLNSFATAITAARPSLIVPSDDLAVSHLHQLYDREKRRGKAGAEICAVIARSLGDPKSFATVSERASFMAVAQEEGIRIPESEVISNNGDLQRWAATKGFPMVVKSDGTSGGDGVRVARNLEEAEAAVQFFEARPSVARAAKRALLDRDTRLVRASLLHRKPVVSAQTFIPGREATSTAACWQGEMLASLHFEVLNKRDSTGPSTVVRFADNPDMASATEKIVRRLGLSGIYGLDFMLDASDGSAYLIEINPRATQVGHLALGPGRDLPAALYAAVTGKVVSESPQVTEKDTITLFPHEWLRNPASSFFQSSYHDVPWDEPEFIRACVGTQRKQKDLYSQQKWVKAFSPARSPR